MSHFAHLFSLVRIGATPKERLVLLMVYIYLYAKDKVSFFPCKSFTFKIRTPYGRCALSVNEISHMWVLKDIFVNLEYDSISPVAPKNIVDLGSNIGLSAVFFALKFPEATIYAVEPNPKVFSLLKRNTETFANVRVFPFAVGEKTESVVFFLSKYDAGSSLFKRSGAMPTVDIEAVAFPDLLERLSIGKIDLLKFDIEGAEQYIFPHLSPERVTLFIGEIHYDMLAPESRKDLTESLLGFSCHEVFTSTHRSILTGEAYPPVSAASRVAVSR